MANVTYCGDGIRDEAYEACDDGADNGDFSSCNTTCGFATCGNGELE